MDLETVAFPQIENKTTVRCFHEDIEDTFVDFATKDSFGYPCPPHSDEDSNLSIVV